MGEDLKKYREDVDVFRETYDNIVAEDKVNLHRHMALPKHASGDWLV